MALRLQLSPLPNLPLEQGTTEDDCNVISRFGFQFDAQCKVSKVDGTELYLEHGSGLCHVDSLLHTLKKCREKKSLPLLKLVQYHICNAGMETHVVLGNHLVQLFVECGCLFDAQRVFNTLLHQNEHSWTSLIVGYTVYGDPQQAFDIYQDMQANCVPPSKFTILAILKACASMHCLENGRKIHFQISEGDFLNDLAITNCLIYMYVKCGSPMEAQEAFDELPTKDIISWNTLISGYVEHGLNQEALDCAQQMEKKCVMPDVVTYVSLFKACGILRAVEKGQDLHADIVQRGHDEDLYVGSSLLDMYARCGWLAEAQAVLTKLTVRDVVTWTALVAGFAEHGHFEQALNCLEQMQLEGMLPNTFTFVSSLKACCELESIDKGKALHNDIIRLGLERDTFVGNTLVDMYAKCGLLGEAQEVFDKLKFRDVISWNALLSGYSEWDLGEEILNCYQQLQREGVLPDVVTFICSLNGCSSLGDMEMGREIHTLLAIDGYEGNHSVGSSLIDMYSKCGSLVEAREVFDELHVRDLVSWTSLISGYVEHGLSDEALNSLEEMQLEGIPPDPITLVCSLKACANLAIIERVREIHTTVVKKGYEAISFVNNCLVEVYAKCSLQVDAWDVFDQLRVQDVVSWNSLILGYLEQGLHKEALDCYEQMYLEGVPADAGTYICCLKSSGCIGAIDMGHKLHTDLVIDQLEKELVVGNNLVEMYARCGLLAESQNVFEDLPIQDVVSWNALIAGYAEQGSGEEALQCLQEMHLDGLPFTDVTFVYGLRACAISRSLDRGLELHAQLIYNGWEGKLSVGNSLVDMYSKFRLMEDARCVFDKLSLRDVTSWTALVTEYVECGLNEEALACLNQMQLEDINPDVITYICILKACRSIGALETGQGIHAEIMKKGFESNVLICNTLLDMYTKCGSLADAHNVFDTVTVRDVITWTVLITGYVEGEFDIEALDIFDEMQVEGLSPDTVTYICALKACGNIRNIEKGNELHAEIVKLGWERELFVQNTLLSMYAKSGSVKEAEMVLDGMTFRDAISWNAVLTGYAELKLAEEARDCFQKMQLDGVPADLIAWNTLTSAYAEQGDYEMTFSLCQQVQERGLLLDDTIVSVVLKACGNAAVLRFGKVVHAQVHDFSDISISTALIDMYSKCGTMPEAQQVFDGMDIKDLVTWNALISGYARQGETDLVLYMFDKLLENGIQPDKVAFLNVLNACSRAGLLLKGWEYLEMMILKYGIAPTIEHCNCVIDLFSRSGQLDEALIMLQRLPFKPDLVLWSTMLSACQKWGNVDLGRQAFLNAMKLGKEDPVSYILMSNIFVDPHTAEDDTSKQATSNAVLRTYLQDVPI